METKDELYLMFQHNPVTDLFKEIYHRNLVKNGYCRVAEKSIPTPQKVIGIPTGRGVLKAKILEAKYEVKLEFPGRGVHAKPKPSMGRGG